MKTRKYKSAGGVLIEDGQLLLLDRPSREEIRLPKGHIEPNESPEETALREVREEAGIADLEITADLGKQTVEFDYKHAYYRRKEYYFLMQRTGEGTVDRSPKDARDFTPIWVPVDEAVDALTYDAEKDVAKRAISVYQQQTDDQA